MLRKSWLLIGVLIVTVPLWSSTYVLRKSVFSSGGVSLSASPNYTLKALAGQSISGRSGSVDYIEESGFYTYGTVIIIGIEENNSQMLPQAFRMFSPYPNPAVGRVTIKYSLPDETRINISVYDISGRLVKTLFNGVGKPGYYSITWDGRSNLGLRVAQGVYFIHISTPGYEATRRVVIVR